MVRLLRFCILPAILAGCTLPPSSIVKQPTIATPAAATRINSNNGAIFQAAQYKPLFEDRRPRNVGDTLTILISEKTNGGKSDGDTQTKSSSVSFKADTLIGLPIKGFQNNAIDAKSAVNLDQKGARSASNNFSGNLTVTVIEVLANGNLVVSGEKQIAFDRGTEFVRFSGVVNPDLIAVGNNISSTQIADARIEYRSNSVIDKAIIMNLLTRFFYSFIPL